MSLAGAITQFKTWTPTGFALVAALDDYDASRIVDEDMPLCLLGVSSIGGQGYKPYEFGGDYLWTVAARVLLISSGLGRKKVDGPQGDLVTLFDNFAAAVQLDPRLNDNLQRPMTMELVSVAPVSLAGSYYYGWELRSIWIVKF